MDSLLFISIHGYHAIQQLTPIAWKKTDKLIANLAKTGKFDSIELMKIGYKNILYLDDWVDEDEENKGFKSTIQVIKRKTDKKTKLVIIGHSLGGFAANILAGELISLKLKIEVLVQIDALPIFLDSPIYNENWFSFNDPKKNNTKQLTFKAKTDNEEKFSGKLKNKLKKIQKRILDIPDDLFNSVEGLLDSLDEEKLNAKYILNKSDLPHVHQRTFPRRKVSRHLYYYSHPESWDIFNHVVHMATNIETGPIPKESKNLRNQALASNHFLIAGKDSIYSDIRLFLTKKKKLFSLTLK